MALVDINWNPSRKDLRVFSLLMIVFGMIVGVVLYQRFESPMPAAIALAVLFLVGVVGLVVPDCVRPIYLLWMGLAFPIGWTVSHVMMLAVFYFVLTPIGLIMRLCGHDPMQRRIDRELETYWIASSVRRDVKSYFRQF